MLGRRPRSRFLVAQLVSDLLAISVGLMVAYWLRFQSSIDREAIVSADYAEQFVWALCAWGAALVQGGCYGNHPRILTYNRARRIIMAGGVAIAIMVALNYFSRTADVARLLYPISFLTVSSCLIGFRLVTQQVILKLMLSNPEVRSRIAIIGTGPVAKSLAKRATGKREYAFDLVGFISPDASRVGETFHKWPVIGDTSSVRDVIREHRIAEIFVTSGELSPEQMQRIFLEAEMEAAAVHVVPNLFEILRTQIYYDEVAGVPIYSIKQTPLVGWNVILKRSFDILATSVGVLLLSPVLVTLYVLVRRDIPGVSPIYRQRRLSLDGREFDCFKFRSMPPNAESKGLGWGNQVDPRATRLGNFMRRWNLDELPQLLNVLRGDMSIVGPRPERPQYVTEFKEEIPRYMARHAVKTGITGWAQVHGLRGDTSIPVRLQYDLYYIENWSLWLDIKIIFMTFFGGGRRSRMLKAQLEEGAEASRES